MRGVPALIAPARDSGNVCYVQALANTLLSLPRDSHLLSGTKAGLGGLAGKGKAGTMLQPHPVQVDTEACACAYACFHSSP